MERPREDTRSYKQPELSEISIDFSAGLKFTSSGRERYNSGRCLQTIDRVSIYNLNKYSNITSRVSRCPVTSGA